jgi:hypothetical protein
MNRTILDFCLHAALVILSTGGLLLLLLVEVYEAYPIPLRYYLWFGALWAVLFLCRFRFRLDRRQLTLLALVLVILAIFYVTSWNPRKPFLRAFFQVQPGMTPSDVRELMRDFKVYESGNTWTFWPEKNWRFDSDGGEVDFVNGVVSERRFSPD